MVNGLLKVPSQTFFKSSLVNLGLFCISEMRDLGQNKAEILGSPEKSHPQLFQLTHQ